MKTSGHKDARIFARYNIVDTNDVAEAMRKVSQYEQEKRLARAKRIVEVDAPFADRIQEANILTLPKLLQ